MSFGFHPEAEAEYYEAIAYYESRRQGLGAGCLVEFEEVMARVVELPLAFPIERSPNIRRAHLTRFPYTVIYREVQGAVQVLAVAHKRRQPGFWAGRL